MQTRTSQRDLLRLGVIISLAALLTLTLIEAVKSQNVAPAAPPADTSESVAKWRVMAFPKSMPPDWVKIAQYTTWWRLSLRKNEVIAEPMRERRTETTRLPFKPKEKGMDGDILAFQVTDGWLVERNAGEWGGELWWYAPNGQKRYRIGYDQVIGFFQTKEGVFAFKGLNHLGINVGSVSRLTQNAKGRWKSEPFVDLHGYPRTWLRKEDGAFLVVTNDRLLRVGQDKKIEALVKNACWYALSPSSLVVAPNQDIYIGMQGGRRGQGSRKGRTLW